MKMNTNYTGQKNLTKNEMNRISGGEKVQWTDAHGNVHTGGEISRTDAKAWVKYLNKKYPELNHRVVQ